MSMCPMYHIYIYMLNVSVLWVVAVCVVGCCIVFYNVLL